VPAPDAVLLTGQSRLVVGRRDIPDGGSVAAILRYSI